VGEELKKAGFVNVKAWTQPCNWVFKDGQDFIEKMKGNWTDVEIDEELRTTIASLYDAQG
jgi:stage V sporulation protein SpoVS